MATARAESGPPRAAAGAAADQGARGARTVAVALIDGMNVPLFLKRFDHEAEKDSLDLLLVIHSALDAFDELRTNARKGARKPYLGLLNLVDGYAVFGYVSNTLVKTIVVLDAESCGYVVPDDAVMEGYLRSLYFAYVDTVSNPFLELGSALQLPKDEDAEGGAMKPARPTSGSTDDWTLPGPGRKFTRHPELLRGFEELMTNLVQRAQHA